jgi:hypothetical protein
LKNDGLDSISDFEAQYTAWFGEPDEVHDLEDARIFVFPPADGDDNGFWTYITGGMSLRTMVLPGNVNPDHDDGVLERAEYVFYASEKSERYIDMLALLVVFPFIDETFVARGHTVGLAQPLDDAGVLTAVFLLSSLFSGHRDVFESVRVHGDRVNYLWVVPISGAERALKVKEGRNALLDLLEENGNPVVFPGARASWC